MRIDLLYLHFSRRKKGCLHMCISTRMTRFHSVYVHYLGCMCVCTCVKIYGFHTTASCETPTAICVCVSTVRLCLLHLVSPSSRRSSSLACTTLPVSIQRRKMYGCMCACLYGERRDSRRTVSFPEDKRSYTECRSTEKDSV